MKIYNYPCKLNTATAVALGRFDGVHTAHAQVIRCASQMKQKGLAPTVFTFCDNPNKQNSQLLTTEEEKQSLIAQNGIEIMVNAAFLSVRNLSAEEFVSIVLKESLGARAVFCGYNYRFGKGASADAETLKVLCEKAGIEVTCVDEYTKEDTPVSSTRIRALLKEGNVRETAKLLGRPYSMEGTVIHGNAIGRTIDTPTLNISVSKEKLLPHFGVYACYAYVDGKKHKAVTNIGMKPTVGSDVPTIEAFLLNAKGDFYNKQVKLELIDFIRPEQKFDSLTDLKTAINLDIEKATEIL
ncbi:MAG: bifunctional riboflavin kinase/FAD synthetase [Ruminococcaceae bacterium]|nr:bifunctional riboflavin kinase/FAD synthetase [Oscillospiraceae bacterium]